jgi:signal transduction histidine kinase
MRSPLAASNPEELLLNVVHELRQPLGNIELTAYYLNLLLGEPKGKVLEQLRAIEEQVDRASLILSEATAAIARLRDQSGGQSLAVTNSASAAVT